MAIKEFLRKLSFEISKRDKTNNFAMKDIYMLGDDEHANLEVGESFISMTGKMGFNKD